VGAIKGYVVARARSPSTLYLRKLPSLTGELLTANARARTNDRDILLPKRRGGEMADATDLKSVDRKVVWVRLPPSAPFHFNDLRGLMI
jgi:hypothetical protein